MHLRWSKQQGFTLVELITVIVLLGVLAVVGGSKFFSNTTFKDSQYHQEVLSAFRFAQKIAIASQCHVTIALTANSYALTYSSASCSGNVKRPDGQADFGESAISSAIISSQASFTYNAAGDLTGSGGLVTIGSNTIIIEESTGFAHD